jgi:hypothetical protein
MNRFQINFLESYSKEEMLEEIKRVASLVTNGKLTLKKFKELSGKVDHSTIRKKFPGYGWKEILESAGVGYLYARPSAKKLTDGELIDELKRVHSLIGPENVLTMGIFTRVSNISFYETISSRFGGWKNALKMLEIPVSNIGKRYTDEECFENLVTVWSHYGRPPLYREMDKPPSVVGPKAYIRWGTWRKALKAFVDWADSEAKNSNSENPQPSIKHESGEKESRKPEEIREVRPGLRFKVFQRDRFRCVACGRSPATHLNVELHADHADSIAANGKTTLENLQTLCQDCNSGKGRLSVHIHETLEKSEI